MFTYSMSSSMPIPGRKSDKAGSSNASDGSASSSFSSPTNSSSPQNIPSVKGKAPLRPSPSETISPRRPSLLGMLTFKIIVQRAMDANGSFVIMSYVVLTGLYSGNSLSKSEHTVIDLGRPDGPPRLVRP